MPRVKGVRRYASRAMATAAIIALVAGAPRARGQTLGAVPAAPSGLSASLLSISSVKLVWTDNSNNETAFAVWRKTATTAYARVAVLAANSTNCTDPGLSPNTSYTYEVRDRKSVA